MNANITKKIDEIITGLKDLTVLNIETVMGNLEVDPKGKINLKPAEKVEGIVSNINLISGDIKTHMTENFYKNYPELVQFHQSREVKGHEIIENNMEALKSIIGALKHIGKPDENQQ